MELKRFIMQALGAIVIKNSVVCEFSYQARVFVRIGWKSLLGTNGLAYYNNS